MDSQAKILAIPSTTEHTVIFPSSAPTIGVEAKFDSSFYAPNLTDGRASTQEIIQVLSDIESSLKPWALKIKRGDYVLLSYTVLSFFAFLYFLLTMSGESEISIIAGIVAFFVGIILSMWILIVYFKNLGAKMRPKCQETIDRHNQHFLPRGLRWRLPTEKNFPKWIELCKDYSQPQGFVNQPINVPQFGQNYSYQQGQSGQNGYVPLGQC